MQKYLGIVLVLMGSSCGGDGSTVVGNPTPVTGELFWSTNEPIDTAIVYVPADANSQVLFDRNIVSACGDNGLAVMCTIPNGISCAASCVCPDGSYTLDISQCGYEVKSFRYCVGDRCGVIDIPCEIGTCTFRATLSVED